jgi:hypothetical protein
MGCCFSPNPAIERYSLVMFTRLRAELAFRTRHKQGRAYAEAFVDHEPPSAQQSAGRIETYFDAYTEGPGVWKWRHYFDIYERHFARFVGTPVTVVEIGVFSGGSFGMWSDYFGRGAQLVGTDIEPACRVYAGGQVRIFIGDQADPGFWRDFLREVPSFDIVIDDGGHQAHQQIPTLEALLPHLRPDGVFLIEDVFGVDNPLHAYVAGLSRQLHQGVFTQPLRYGASAFQRAIGSIHLYPLVVVIEKRHTKLEIFEAPKRGTEWQPGYDEVAGKFVDSAS